MYDDLINAWTPVVLDDYDTTKFPPHGWTLDGFRCLETNRDCDNCELFKTYEIRWLKPFPKACWQPVAVQKLLNKKAKIPANIIRTPRTDRHSAFKYGYT